MQPPGEAEHDLDTLHLEGFDQGLGPCDLHRVVSLDDYVDFLRTGQIVARKTKRPPGWEAKTHAYVGVRLHEYYDNRGDFGTH